MIPHSYLTTARMLPAIQIAALRPFALTALVLVALLLTGCALTEADTDTNADSGADTGTMVDRTLLFSDDFDESALDRTKWNVEGPAFWVNNEQQIYIDDASTIRFEADGSTPGADDGFLVLEPHFRAGFEAPTGRIADFVSGRINTRDRFDFTYGRAEARIRMPDAEGVWPAFWLLGNGSWPDTGEIDIMEYVGENDWTAVALHGPGYSGETPLVNKYFFPDGEDVTDWRVYAVEWTRDRIEFFIDDRLIYRVTRPMVEHYGPWRFDTPKYLILNVALGGAYPFKTNGIETPYNGLPAETVALIREGGVYMHVDWVRVWAPLD